MIRERQRIRPRAVLGMRVGRDVRQRHVGQGCTAEAPSAADCRRYPRTSGLMALSRFGFPSSTLRMFSAVTRAMAATDSVVTPAMCGEVITVSSDNSVLL